MRTIGFRSNVLFILAAAFGLVAALGRPWYAPAPVATAQEVQVGNIQGQAEGFFLRISREVSTSGGTDGWHAFTTTDTLLVGLLAITVITAIGSLVSGIEQPSREILRIVTLAMLGIVVVKLVNTPDSHGLVERRQGAWLALGVTGIMASSASTLYAAPLKRRKRGPSLVEHPLLVVPPRSTAFDSPPYTPPVDRY